MLKRVQYEMIGTGYRLYGQNISELSRLTGHSRNTIKKAIRGEPWDYKEREQQRFPAIDPFRVTIDSWLESDREKPQEAAAYGVSGIQSVGGKCRVARGVNPVFAGMCGWPGCFLGSERHEPLFRVIRRLDIEAEVDWGHATAIIAGDEVRLKFFCMWSKYSGKHFVRVLSL